MRYKSHDDYDDGTHNKLLDVQVLHYVSVLVAEILLVLEVGRETRLGVFLSGK